MMTKMYHKKNKKLLNELIYNGLKTRFENVL